MGHLVPCTAAVSSWFAFVAVSQTCSLWESELPFVTDSVHKLLWRDFLKCSQAAEGFWVGGLGVTSVGVLL